MEAGPVQSKGYTDPVAYVDKHIWFKKRILAANCIIGGLGDYLWK